MAFFHIGDTSMVALVPERVMVPAVGNWSNTTSLRGHRCRAGGTEAVSALVAASPELKRLWIRVLKRVHPDLAVDEQDRRRCERLTQQANDAFARRDEVALRAVLEPKGPPRPTPSDAWEAGAQAQPSAPPQSPYQPPLAPQRRPTLIGPEAIGILWAACAVLCLLLYGIFAALSEEVGRGTSLFFLVLLTAAVLWTITKKTNWPYEHKARWVAAVASGMFLVGICLLNSHPQGKSAHSIGSCRDRGCCRMEKQRQSGTVSIVCKCNQNPGGTELEPVRGRRYTRWRYCGHCVQDRT